MVLATFEDYVMERLPALLRLAGGLCGNPHTAEDVVQEVLLRAGASPPLVDSKDVDPLTLPASSL